MRSGLVLFMLTAATMSVAQNSDPAKVAEYARTLPVAAAPVFDEQKKEMLASLAISCADHPQENTGTRNNYLWSYEKMPVILENYDRNRAFYGCSNWHDAVADTWMMMSLLRQDPKIALGSDIKDIATTHFRKGNMDGEMAFITTPRPASENPGGAPVNFEQPYGYSWLLKLYGEAKGYNNADGKKMATALAPLARWMSEKYVFYLYNLKFPFRTGTETNTSWSMSLTLDGVNLSEDTTLQTAVKANALRLFSKDKDCPTGLEPQNTDNVSSCLTEAALMGRVMEQADFLKWLDEFLPPVYSELFQGYAKPIDTSHTSTTGPDAQVQLTAKSHLIALSFQRAYDLLNIAYALPKDDARVPVFKTLAAMNATRGYENIGGAGYEGEHLLATYALLYENATQGPAPLAPEKPKPGAKDGEPGN
jgi:Protein of unknown function (DUF2891)